MKRNADIVFAIAAGVKKVWRQNRQRRFHQEGSGYVLANFQAEQFYIVVPGSVFVRGRRHRQCCGLIPGLQTAVKAKKRSASLPIHRIPPRQMFFCFREVKSELADLMLSQGVLMTNLDGVVKTGSKNDSAADF
jgi:hypothetical protein